MTSGSCLCGVVKIVIDGEPMASVGSFAAIWSCHLRRGEIAHSTNEPQALCHCFDCRKTSGSAFGFNWVVRKDQLAITGASNIKEYTKPAQNGNPVTNHFCVGCGTTLWRDGPATKGICYLKAGILDDPEEVDKRNPKAEIFTTRRISWMSPVEGAFQKKELEE